MNPILSKLPQVGLSIFAEMTALANEWNAINLSQGFPDFAPPEELIELVHFYMQKGCNQYSPMMGIPPIRKALSDKIGDLYGHRYDIEKEITITSGATEALFSTLSAIVKEGSEVILFAPAYDSYDPVIRLNGGIPRYISLTPPDYKISWDKVREAITEKTVAILINSPHNPTGTVLSKGDMEELSALVKGTDLLIISDEVYEHIIFDGEEHQSVIKYPELRKRSFAIFSFGKTYHTTGWKVGYCVAPEPLSAEFRRIHQFVTFSTSTPFQFALAEFMKKKDFYRSLPSFFQKKRDFFLEVIRDTPFKPLPCKGTYFVMLDYSEITEAKDTDYAHSLTRERRVASIPVSVFYPEEGDHKVLRFCFAKEKKTLEEAGKRLCQISK